MFNVVIVGATGLVGQALIELLGDREFPIKKLVLLAINKS